MRIYLVRHAESVDRVGMMPDSARYLTARGRASFREAAARFREAGATPAFLLTSPFVRAVQTAEILAEAVRYDGTVIVAPQLAPGFDLGGLNAVLDGCPGGMEVALVGHEPDMGRVLTQLLSLPASYGMRKGAIAALDVPEAGNRLRARFAWLLEGEKRITEVSALSG
ncbi:MAG TPA: histidine phosphatase family protein [Candidatus Deferrimicrobiaceae bacterium]